MAIQLPKIQRNDVYNAAGNLPEAQAIGAEAGFNLAEGNIKMVDAVGKAIERSQENDRKLAIEQERAVQEARKTRSKSISNQYNILRDKDIADFDANLLGADLTPQYEKVKANAEKIKDELRKQANDPETLALLEQEFLSQDAVLDKTVEVKYARSRVAYNLRTGKDRNELLKDEFLKGSVLFDQNDPSSTIGLDAAMIKMKINTLDTAQALGTVSFDSAGQPIYPDSVEKDYINERSNTVVLAVNSLVGENDPIRAKHLLERYEQYVKPEQLTDLTSKLNTSIRNQGYYNTAAEVAKETDPDKRTAAIEEYATRTKDPEATTKIGNIVNSMNIKKKQAQDEKQQLLYDDISEKILTNQDNPSSRFYTIDELTTNPKFNSQYNLLTAENKKKIQGLIKQPETSDLKTLREFEKQTNSPDGWKDISEKQFRKGLARLSEIDSATYLKHYRLDKDPRKKGLTSQVKNQFISEVQKALIANDVLPAANDPEFVNEWNGKYSSFVLDEISNLPANTNKATPEYQQAVKKIVDDIIKDSYDNSNVFKKFGYLIKNKFQGPGGGSVNTNQPKPPATKTRTELLDEL